MKTKSIFLVLLLFTANGPAAEPVRNISADWQKVKGPHAEVFKECVGAGRAAEGLRAEWQRQLRLCQSEIGFKSIRFHGLLHDEMGVYAETRDGRPRYNWHYVDELYDALLAMKVRPFVELGFMPRDLASGRQTVFWWKGNVSPPKSNEEWGALIKALVTHWVERYGRDEVARWRFEVWNEADYHAFFAPRNPDHRREEYFELYRHTAAAIKSVDSAFRVGGPAGAKVDWIQPMIAYCQTNKVPLDFISFHAYGLGDGPGGLDEFGERLQFLSPDLRQPSVIVMQGRSLVDATPMNGLPVHVTEWSASYSPRDPVHDSYFSAPYILEQIKRTERGVGSMSYWTFTDIFEEAGPPMSVFHGGFGLLTMQGIKKPAYFAFQFMNRLGPTELENPDEASWVCRDANGNAQVLLWNLTHPIKDNRSNQSFFRQLHPAKDATGVRVRLSQVPPGDYKMTVWRVGFGRNDACSAWLQMGSPPQLTQLQEQRLREASQGAPEFEVSISVTKAGVFEHDLPLRENEVILVTLVKQ